VLYDQGTKYEWVEPTDLAGGTYYYRTQPVSDGGIAGTASAVETKIILTYPAAPTLLTYVSGNAAATVISFRGSTTTGVVSYNVYKHNVDGELNPNDIDSTIAADTAWAAGTVYAPGAYVRPLTGVTGYRYRCSVGGTSGTGPTWRTVVGGTTVDGATVRWICEYYTATLTNITGLPGYAHCVVRAVLATVEEKNQNVLELEYSVAGVYIVPRPNTPSIDKNGIVITTGTALSLRGIYATKDEKGTATKLQLFLRDAADPASVYDYTSPAAEATLGGVLAGIKVATLTATLTAGLWYAVLKSSTVAGVQSVDPSNEVLLNISIAAHDAPTEAVPVIARG
jgi:hypothetical protein